jgi:pimeloyl-ACP methyl ester carboxylesterase
VVKLPVAFEVANTNRSALSCASDGAQYEVKGHLIGPAARLAPDVPRRPRAVTLYLHDFAVGGFFWSFAGVPRYDYAAGMARAGHVSVVVDRLGYGSSGRPDGNDICLGAHADVAHQVVGKLRSGDYVTDGGPPARFDRVALAGHGVGALIANLEAFSFKDIDALVAMGYTPQVTQQAFHHFYTNRTVCEAGGEPSQPGGPGRYAFFGQAQADFRASGFHSAPAAVIDVATTLRARDPCGDTASIVGALVRDLKSLSSVKAPVLVVCGREDAVTPDFACPYLERRYVGSSDVSLVFVPRAGHALPLERTAPTFRRRVAAWLQGHGF